MAGSAEATTLPDASVDFVTAAQAAHWFDRPRTRREFVRILKPQGWLVLLWNERLTDSTPFLRAYEQLLLDYGTDYADVRHERTTDAVNEFFDPAPYQERTFPMRQEFDYAGLEGRLLSSSYAPGPGHPKHEPMLQELRRIFDAHAAGGQVGVRLHDAGVFRTADQSINSTTRTRSPTTEPASKFALVRSPVDSPRLTSCPKKNHFT